MRGRERQSTEQAERERDRDGRGAGAARDTAPESRCSTATPRAREEPRRGEPELGLDERRQGCHEGGDEDEGPDEGHGLREREQRLPTGDGGGLELGDVDGGPDPGAGLAHDRGGEGRDEGEPDEPRERRADGPRGPEIAFPPRPLEAPRGGLERALAHAFLAARAASRRPSRTSS